MRAELKKGEVYGVEIYPKDEVLAAVYLGEHDGFHFFGNALSSTNPNYILVQDSEAVIIAGKNNQVTCHPHSSISVTVIPKDKIHAIVDEELKCTLMKMLNGEAA
ncbi:MAG TPA: hypothetical protein VMC07_00310 [Candidatus Omnitrophota bacterium]|nr:hypothetical protein [Candidatus Omnitrophota bacterium]